jgi:hypothetical protein
MRGVDAPKTRKKKFQKINQIYAINKQENPNKTRIEE